MKKVIITGILSFLFLVSCSKKKQETTTPTLAPITEAVFAPGHIEAAGQFTLTALNDGYITDVLVVEGTLVTLNQEILKQDNTTAFIMQNASNENLKIAQQQASSNSAVLQQLEAQLASARAKMQNSKEQMERLQRLYTTKSVAKIELDNAQLDYESLFNDVVGIQKNIETTKLNLKQSLIDSKSQQLTATANTNYFNIKSPGNYKVYSLLKRKGDLVRKGEAVAVLGDPQSLKIVLNIDEASIAKIKINQIVLVELNTEKSKVLNAYISKIYPAFEESSQSYKVEATFKNTQNKIINGTLLQSNIIVGQKSEALLIPRNSLSADGKVILKKEKKNDTIQVQTGLIGTDWVEIIKGINAGDEIIKTY